MATMYSTTRPLMPSSIEGKVPSPQPDHRMPPEPGQGSMLWNSPTCSDTVVQHKRMRRRRKVALRRVCVCVCVCAPPLKCGLEGST